MTEAHLAISIASLVVGAAVGFYTARNGMVSEKKCNECSTAKEKDIMELGQDLKETVRKQSEDMKGVYQRLETVSHELGTTNKELAELVGFLKGRAGEDIIG